MANTIKIKSSGLTGNTPSSLEHGELALNYADGKIFYKNNSNSIVQFGIESFALNDINNVTAPTPSSGDFLKWNGSAWINDAIDLNTDTTGSYVTSLVAGTNVTLSNNSGEGATPTVSVSGALTSVDSISTPDFIQFDTTYTPATLAAGKMQWDPDYGTLQLGLIGGNTNLQIGQEMLVYIYNDTTEATSLTTGELVFINGVQGDKPTVRRASTSNSIDPSKPIGMVTETIPYHQYGFICISGAVHGINTSAYTAGDIVWLSATAGQFTKTQPSPPTDNVFIGVILKSNPANGAVWIAPQNGYKLNEIHDVSAASPSSGDFLKYNGTLWVNDPINLGTDTVGDYVSSLVAGSGITLSNNSGEGATPTVALTSNSITINGTSIALGTSGTVTANAQTLTGTSLNSTVVGSSLTSVGNVTSGTWSAGTIAVSYGGTGVTTITANGVLYGNGTGAIANTGAGTSGQVLTAGTGGVPTWTANTGTGNVVRATSPSITTSITTANTSFDLINTTATTLNIGGGASTSVNIGNASGIVNINATKLSINNSNGAEGGELFLAQPASNTTLAGGITIDAFQDRLRFFEQGGGARGYFLDLTLGANGATTAILYNTFTSPSFVTSITTSSSTFSLVNTTATTVNFAGAATTLNMGVTGGTTTISGAVSVGTTLTTGGFVKSSGRFDADDSLSFWIARNNGGTVLFRASTASTVYADTITGRAVQINSAGTMGTTTSTIRNKKDISDYIFDTEAVLAIKPVRFKYKDEMFSSEEDADKNWQYGFIAEQAYDAGLSEMLGFDDEGLPDYFSYERMCVAQQQVIRELWEKVKTLEEQVGLAT
jgi:hypothetical protein